LEALQKARLGRTVDGNDVMRGVNVQLPIDAAIDTSLDCQDVLAKCGRRFTM
jgi:hypothetical protein